MVSLVRYLNPRGKRTKIDWQFSSDRDEVEMLFERTFAKYKRLVKCDDNGENLQKTTD